MSCALSSSNVCFIHQHIVYKDTGKHWKSEHVAWAYVRLYLCLQTRWAWLQSFRGGRRVQRGGRAGREGEQSQWVPSTGVLLFLAYDQGEELQTQLDGKKTDKTHTLWRLHFQKKRSRLIWSFSEFRIFLKLLVLFLELFSLLFGD